MPLRTIQVLGQGYNTDGDTTATVEVDGVQIFSGAVPTINSAKPQFVGKIDSVICSFTVDVSFVGHKEIKITCNAGQLVCGDFLSNYVRPFQIDNGPRIKLPSPQRWLALRGDPKFSDQTHFGSMESITRDTVGVSDQNTPMPRDEYLTLDATAISTIEDVNGSDALAKPVVKINGVDVDRTPPPGVTVNHIFGAIEWPPGRAPTVLTPLNTTEHAEIQLYIPHAWLDETRITPEYAKTVPGAVYTDYF